MARRRYDDEDEDDYDPSPRRYRSDGETDVFGIIGLILGVIAVVCLVMTCGSCLVCPLFGVAYFAVVPLALIGGVCSFFGRGGMKIAGLVLNVLTLIPGVIVLGMMLTGAGMNMINPPVAPEQKQDIKQNQNPDLPPAPDPKPKTKPNAKKD